MLQWLRLPALFAALCFSTVPALAQTAEEDLKKEIEALKKGQEDIKRQLQQLQNLIQSRIPQRPSAPNVRNVVFDIGSDNPTKGGSTAPLTLVEFTDYQ